MSGARDVGGAASQLTPFSPWLGPGAFGPWAFGAVGCQRVAEIDGDVAEIDCPEIPQVSTVIIAAVPMHIKQQAVGIHAAFEGIYSRPAQRMMRKMGWNRGTGLGKSGQGVLEPMAAADNSSSGQGLGYRQKKPRTRPQLKVLTWYDEEGQECDVNENKVHALESFYLVFWAPIGATPPAGAKASGTISTQVWMIS